MHVRCNRFLMTVVRDHLLLGSPQLTQPYHFTLTIQQLQAIDVGDLILEGWKPIV